MERFPDWKHPIKELPTTPWEVLGKNTPFIRTAFHWYVYHPENFELGNNTDIGAGTWIFAHHGVVIEDDVQIGGLCLIYSLSTIDGKQGKVHIKRGAKIGCHSSIMPGVTIGENAIVGAHSMVTKDVPDGETWFGVPAKRHSFIGGILDYEGLQRKFPGILDHVNE